MSAETIGHGSSDPRHISVYPVEQDVDADVERAETVEMTEDQQLVDAARQHVDMVAERTYQDNERDRKEIARRITALECALLQCREEEAALEENDAVARNSTIPETHRKITALESELAEVDDAIKNIDQTPIVELTAQIEKMEHIYTQHRLGQDAEGFVKSREEFEHKIAELASRNEELLVAIRQCQDDIENSERWLYEPTDEERRIQLELAKGKLEKLVQGIGIKKVEVTRLDTEMRRNQALITSYEKYDAELPVLRELYEIYEQIEEEFRRLSQRQAEIREELKAIAYPAESTPQPSNVIPFPEQTTRESKSDIVPSGPSIAQSTRARLGTNLTGIGFTGK